MATATAEVQTVTIKSLEDQVICLRVMSRNIAVTVCGMVRFVDGLSGQTVWVGEFACPPTFIVDKDDKKDSHYIMYLWEQEGESFSS